MRLRRSLVRAGLISNFPMRSRVIYPLLRTAVQVLVRRHHLVYNNAIRCDGAIMACRGFILGHWSKPMHSFQSVLRSALFVALIVICWPGHCPAAEMLWQKNLQMGLPDTPFISADITPGPGLELAFATTTGNLVVCNIEGEILWTAGGYSVFCVPPAAGDLFPGGGMELLRDGEPGWAAHVFLVQGGGTVAIPIPIRHGLVSHNHRDRRFEP